MSGPESRKHASAFRRWMAALCAGLMSVLGSAQLDWRAWRGE
jgi:hypothetical protein